VSLFVTHIFHVLTLVFCFIQTFYYVFLNTHVLNNNNTHILIIMFFFTRLVELESQSQCVDGQLCSCFCILYNVSYVDSDLLNFISSLALVLVLVGCRKNYSRTITIEMIRAERQRWRIMYKVGEETKQTREI